MEEIKKKYANRKLSPLKSIKAYCKEMCSAGDRESWQECNLTSCFLYKYRLGRGNRGIKENLSIKPPISTNEFLKKGHSDRGDNL